MDRAMDQRHAGIEQNPMVGVGDLEGIAFDPHASGTAEHLAYESGPVGDVRR
jgi:hypothetical protein